MKKNKDRIDFSVFFKNSAIFAALISFSEFICEKCKESCIFKFLAKNKSCSDGMFDRFFNNKLKFKKRISIPFKRFAAKSFEKSNLLRKLGILIEKLPNIQIRTVGSMLFSFGLSVSLIYLLNAYTINSLKNISDLYIGIICSVLGGFLSIYQKKLGDVLCESKILSFLMFSVLGLKKENFTASKNLSGHVDYGFILGFVIGAATFFVSPVLPVIIMLFLPSGYLILKTPESGVVLTILMIPVASSEIMAVLCSYVSLCWLLKLIRGKRTLSMSSLDITVLAFSFIVFLGGIFSVTPTESLKEAWIFISHMSVFLLAVNLIKTSSWMLKCIKAILFSASVSVLFLLSNYIELLLSSRGFFSKILSDINEIPLNSFGSMNNLVYFTVMTLPFIFLGTRILKKSDSKFIMICISILACITLLLLNSKYIFFTVVISTLILISLFNHKFIPFGIISLGISALLYSPLSQFILNKIGTSLPEQYSLSEKINLMSSADKIISDCFAGGIGLGKAAFSKVFALYSSGSMQNAENAGDLYSQTIISLGAAGLIVLILLFTVFLHNFILNYSSAFTYDRNLRCISFAGLCSVVITAILGFNFSVLSDSKTLFLFFLAVGLTSSAFKIGERERIDIIISEPFVDIALTK